MLLSALSRIAGPKVLLGVVLAGLAGMGTLWWFYTDAAGDAATAEQRAADLKQALSEQRGAVERLRSERRALQQALSDARESARQARQRADAASERLDELERTNEQVKQWARDRVPDAVARELRQYANRADDPGGGTNAGATGDADGTMSETRAEDQDQR